MKILKLLYTICLLLIVSCNRTAKKTTTTFGINDNAFWIEDGIALPESDSLFYLEHPAPLFRKDFKSDKSIKSATLSITAAGYYKVFINGSGIKENVLDPAWTDFSKRIYYSEYDVTSRIQNGV